MSDTRSERERALVEDMNKAKALLAEALGYSIEPDRGPVIGNLIALAAEVRERGVRLI